ncbi:hypothetical protein PUR34_21735 [Streptomyces sp. JV185]|uniref:hypothetical protein n=1 Tax=Streptomyces sp. JV185 TaxID=858638 RepID=UPI002E78C629|nr:hypothetical protein [Streptomyces sp. JV185]MEE1770683.1 hypothetical protein [Streptomyces sp. JV185]
MTLLHSTAGPGRRRLAAPTAEESVPQPVPRPMPPRSVPHSTDPPIYRALLRRWESAGRTLPGRHDQEWNRIMAMPVWSDRPLRVSASQDPRGGAR